MIVILLASVALAHATTGLAANQVGNQQDSIVKLRKGLTDKVQDSTDKLLDKLVDKLVGRSLKASPLLHPALENTAIGHLAIHPGLRWKAPVLPLRPQTAMRGAGYQPQLKGLLSNKVQGFRAGMVHAEGEQGEDTKPQEGQKDLGVRDLDQEAKDRMSALLGVGSQDKEKKPAGPTTISPIEPMRMQTLEELRKENNNSKRMALLSGSGSVLYGLYYALGLMARNSEDELPY